MFEKKFGQHLKELLFEELNKKLETEYVEITLSSNNLYRPLEKDADEIAMIVRTGNASQSHVQGYDLNTLPFTVSFTVNEKHVTALLEALTAISLNENGKSGEMDIDGVSSKYKVIYNTPYMTGGPYDIRSCANNRPTTVKAVNIIWFMTITYSSNAIIELPKFELGIGSVVYEIDFLINYSAVMNPVYDGNLISGGKYMKQDAIALNKSFVFTILKASPNVSELQDLLMSDLETSADSLANSELSLRKTVEGNTTNIPISTINVSYSFEGNAGVIILTLGR